MSETLDKLARFRSDRFPVINLYLDARPGPLGRDLFQPYTRKELAARGRPFALRSAERQSFERDAERIQKYLAEEVRPSAGSWSR